MRLNLTTSCVITYMCLSHILGTVWFRELSATHYKHSSVSVSAGLLVWTWIECYTGNLYKHSPSKLINISIWPCAWTHIIFFLLIMMWPSGRLYFLLLFTLLIQNAGAVLVEADEGSTVLVRTHRGVQMSCNSMKFLLKFLPINKGHLI